MTPGASPDRAVDVALAEFNALRAEILSHSTSQTTVLGLGVSVIGVVLGLAVNSPGRLGILIVIPVVCGVLILVYAGLAYRIVVAGNYVRRILWPYLAETAAAPDLPSWERSLARLESRGVHRVLAPFVELCLVGLLCLIGGTASLLASGVPDGLRWGSGGLLVVAAGVGVWLARRRCLTEDDFAPRDG